MAVVGVYVLVAVSVFAVNLVPAFGPPTWAVLVLWYLGEDLSEAALVVVGAVAAASGRLVLGWATGRLRGRLPARYRENLLAAGRRLLAHRRSSWAGLVAFALSPLPSAQLFEAAGLLRLRLAPLTAAFFVGRTVSYSIYLATTKIVRRTDAGQALASSLRSPWAVLPQVVMLAGLVMLARVNWSPRPHHDERGGEPPAGRSY
jgi:membrane protein YqaA with SNARE-associated domain